MTDTVVDLKTFSNLRQFQVTRLEEALPLLRDLRDIGIIISANTKADNRNYGPNATVSLTMESVFKLWMPTGTTYEIVSSKSSEDGNAEVILKLSQPSRKFSNTWKTYGYSDRTPTINDISPLRYWLSGPDNKADLRKAKIKHLKSPTFDDRGYNRYEVERKYGAWTGKVEVTLQPRDVFFHFGYVNYRPFIYQHSSIKEITAPNLHDFLAGNFKIPVGSIQKGKYAFVPLSKTKLANIEKQVKNLPAVFYVIGRKRFYEMMRDSKYSDALAYTSAHSFNLSGSKRKTLVSPNFKIRNNAANFKYASAFPFTASNVFFDDKGMLYVKGRVKYGKSLPNADLNFDDWTLVKELI
jgi:hypothetical protein